MKNKAYRGRSKQNSHRNIRWHFPPYNYSRNEITGFAPTIFSELI